MFNDNDDYEVGRGKPPKHTQFKPGQSGNRKGRPKGSRNYTTELREEGNELLAISENGRTRKLPKRRVIIKRMMNKALNGDIRAGIYMLEKLLALDAAQGPAGENLSENDKAIITAYLKRNKPEPEGGGYGSQSAS